MRRTGRAGWLKGVALVAVAGLTLAACGSDNNSGSTSTPPPTATAPTSAGSTAPTDASTGESTAPTGDTGSETTGENTAPPAASTGIVLANGTEPQNPLIPTNTNEVGGGRILDLIFSGLVYYDAKGAPINEVADSIESTDGQNYTIKLKSGWKFSNGEDVTASSFVDAWNYGALATNAQLSASFFEPIVGYDDVSFCEEGKGPVGEDGTPGCLPAPKAQTMTGLKVVSDSEFTVALTSPQSDFPLRLGYSAFFPLPKAAFSDMKAFGEAPIGNGPYMIGGDGWQHNAQIDLVPSPSYTGGQVPQNGGVTFTFYDGYEAAYADLQGGNLDVIDNIPPNALATFQTDLGDRAVNQPAAVFQSFTIPQKLAHFSGEEGKLRRQAISLAINREEVTSIIFSSTRTPAKDFTSPVIAGWSDSLPGSDVLNFDAAKAKDLWAQADAISPWDGKFTIGYNSDGGHKEWVDAVCNQIKNNLGIDAEGNPYASFAELRADVTDRKIKGGFRTGWQADYPGMYNFLFPLYSTGAGSNDGDYSSADFDKLMKEGASAATVEEGTAKFSEAQQILFKDLPAIPLWYANVTGGSSTAVSNVEFGWNSVPLYYEITKN
ncbi:ABC transporter substrate-binding protein [Nakamurella silvestris]|nr:ABC transporter substrate-binding protein [Nakamurella silvestris]